MNTQFKVGQQFKDSKGTVLTVKKVNLHDYYKSSPDTFYTVGIEFEYFGQIHSTYIPQFQIEKLLNSGELTEVQKLSAAERMADWLYEESLNSDRIQAYRLHCSSHLQKLNQLINEEKNG